jgi:hypothetical protein
MSADLFQSYYNELEQYYKLKTKYEDIKQKKINELIVNKSLDFNQKKQTLAKFKPKCVNCKAEGGTIFTETPELLRATCGNSANPCNLDLTIKRKKFAHINNQLIQSSEEVVKYKKQIISTKLDFLFNYIEEEKAVELFETLKLQLNSSQESYNNLVNLYNSITNNEELKTMVFEKTNEFETNKKQYSEALELYKSSGEIVYLISAIEIHKTKLAVIGKELMNLKYKSCYVEKNEEDKYILFQNNYNLEDLIVEINDNL